MRYISRLARGYALVPALVAAAAVVTLALGASIIVSTEEAVMRIEPRTLVRTVGETFDVHIVVDAHTPVNVFSGDLSFDPQVVRIDAIEYDTSIADLWAMRPWYENGDGTMNFGGGTTVRGGFMGTGTLITIHFRALAPGAADVSITNARIFRHDGLGTDIPLDAPIDSILTIVPAHEPSERTRVFVAEIAHPLDLNGDGRITLADASVMMLHTLGTDLRYDLNNDGAVDRTDLGIVLRAL